MTIINAAQSVHGMLSTEEIFSQTRHPIDLYLGPYRTGKTRALIQQILEVHRRDPFAETIVVVPSARYQAVFEQRLGECLKQLSQNGVAVKGLVGLRIMNFYALTQMLYRRAGNTFRIVPEQIRPSIIGRVSAELRDQGELKTLSKISAFVGTQQNVLGLVDELERAALSPEEVLHQLSLSAHNDSRYVELAKIYGLYWQELKRLNLMDERQVAFALRETLSSGTFTPTLQHFFVDGFDRLNKLQLQVFAELSKHVAKMAITFDYAEVDGRVHPDYVWKESSYQSLNTQLRGQFNLVSFAERGASLAQEERAPAHKFSVTDRLSEMEEIARRVKQAVVAQKTKPQEILVVARSLKNYGNAVRAAFDDAGVNYFVDEPIEIAKLPVVRFLSSILTLHQDGFVRKDLVDCLRSHYFNPRLGFKRWQIDELDRRSLAKRVVAGRAQWLEVFDSRKSTPARSAEVSVEAEADSEVEVEIQIEAFSQPVEDTRGSEIDSPMETSSDVAEVIAPEFSNEKGFTQTAKPKLVNLFDRLQPLPVATASEHVKWAENLIEHVFAPVFSKQPGFNRRPAGGALAAGWFESNKEYQRWIEQKAVGEFRRALSTLLLEEAYLGPQRMSARDFAARVERLISKANFRPVPRVKDAVTICGADIAPNRAFDQVFIAGMVEGEFPRKGVSAGFVGADEIARWASFGIDIANPRFHSAFEIALFKNLSTRARHRIHLSNPLRELGGDELLPSILMADEQLGAKTESDSSPPPTVYGILARAYLLPCSPRNAFAGAMSDLGPSASLSQRFGRLENISANSDVALLVDHLAENMSMAYGRLSADRSSVYNGFLSDHVLSGALHVVTPDLWSPTKLSEYGKCGFRFWVSHVLSSDPVEEPQAGLDDRLLGDTYHKALELFYKRLIANKLLITDDYAQVMGHFDAAVDEALLWLQGNRKFRQSEFWKFEQLEVRFRLKRFVSKEMQRALKDKHQFAPVLLEASFDANKEPGGEPVSSDPLFIRDGARTIAIHGRIDRIDISLGEGAGQLARVVDYKKGSSLITPDEAYRGRNLQMALYAMAVQKSILKNAHTVEGVYLSVSSGGPIGKLRFGAWEKEREDEADHPKLFEQTESYVRQYVQGIEQGNFLVQPNGLDLCKRCRHKSVCRIAELDVPANLE
jgi:ATP-dependent helicase/DNAse subunit B